VERVGDCLPDSAPDETDETLSTWECQLDYSPAV